MKVALCTPSRSGRVSDAYAQSMFKTGYHLATHGIDSALFVCRSMPILTDARNFLVACALDTGCDKMVFIDDDMSWNPDDLLRLIKSDKDVIGGVYQGRNMTWDAPARLVVKWPPNSPSAGMLVPSEIAGQYKLRPDIGPFEVYGLGGGFLCIHTKVFKKLIADGKVNLYLPYAQKTTEGESWWLHHYDFFAYGRVTWEPKPEHRTSLDKIGYPQGDVLSNVGEDYYFCDMARDAGFPTWADPDCKLTHYDGCVEHNLHLGNTRFDNA